MSAKEERRDPSLRQLRKLYRCAAGDERARESDYMPPDPSTFAAPLNPKTVFLMRQPGGRCETLRDFGGELLRILADLIGRGCTPSVLARWLNDCLQLAPVDVALRDDVDAVAASMSHAMSRSQWLDARGRVTGGKPDQIKLATAAVRAVGITTQAWPEPFKHAKQHRAAKEPTKN
jgi:hypothetical protein